MIAGIIAREGIKGFIPYGAGYVAGTGIAAYQAAKGIYNLTKKKETKKKSVRMAKRKVSTSRGVSKKRKTVSNFSRSRRRKRRTTRGRKSAARQVSIGASTTHSGTSSALCIVNAASKKKVKKVGNWVYRAQYQCISGTGLVAPGAGNVASATIFGLLTKKSLTSPDTYIPLLGPQANIGSDNTGTVRTLFQLNPYQKVSGSADFAGTNQFWVAGAQPNNDKIYVDSASCMLDLSNMTTISNNVQISVFLCKKDTNSNPITMANDLMFYYNVGGVVTGNYVPSNSTTLATTGISDVVKSSLSIPGSRYDECRDLSKWWKMVCNEEFVLAAGASKKIDMVLKINKTIDKLVVEASQYAFIKGYSIVCMVRSYGQVVLDTEAEAAHGKLVTYGPSEIACVASLKYHCAAVKENANRIKIDIAQIGVSRPTNSTDLKQVSNVDVEIAVGVV